MHGFPRAFAALALLSCSSTRAPAGAAKTAAANIQAPKTEAATSVADTSVADKPEVPKLDGAPLVAITPDVYVEPAVTTDERAHLLADLRTGRERLAEQLGPLVTEAPLAIFCKTQACGLAFAGPSQRSRMIPKGTPAPNGFVAPRTTIVVLRVDAEAKTVAMHEAVHAELHQRMRGAKVPTWFHEGAAAWLSDAPACRHPLHEGIDDLSRLTEPEAWSVYTDFRTAMEPTYCQAKAEIAAWVAKNGVARFVDMVNSVHGGGTEFDASYGPMLSRRPARRTPVMTLSTEIGDPTRPFSIALWVEPKSNTGVLVGLAETPVGSGWCAPLLGFDESHHLVAQLLRRGQPDLDSFTRATSARELPRGAWSHVAMTWSPGGMQRLYVNGKQAAEVKSGDYFARGAGWLMYLSWGSCNVAGPGLCWPGAIGATDFDGLVEGVRVEPAEWTADQVAALAKARP
jgi:hypothetical protein